MGETVMDDYWQSLLDGTKERVMVVHHPQDEGKLLVLVPGSNPESYQGHFRGFGGRLYTLQMLVKGVPTHNFVVSNDMWNGSVVPDEWYEEFSAVEPKWRIVKITHMDEVIERRRNEQWA